VAAHSVGYYEEAPILIRISVEIILVPTPHPSGVGSRGNSKMH